MGDLETLWREVLAHLADDGPRVVLADALQAAGDPRGELMGLQLLAADDDHVVQRQQRIQALTMAHAPTWLGDVWGYIDGVCFERGLPSRLAPSPWTEPPEGIERAWASPVLQSVTELILPAWPGGFTSYDPFVPYGGWLRHADLPALRAVELRIDKPFAIPLSQALAHVSIHGAGAHTSARDIDQLVRVLRKRPTIRSLAIDVHGAHALVGLQPAWLRSLDTLVVAANVRAGLALWDQLPVRRLIVAPSSALPPCTIAYPYDYRIEIVRDEGLARISGEWVITPMAMLDALPAVVERVEIEYASDPIAARLAAALPRELPVTLRRTKRAGNLNIGRGARG